MHAPNSKHASATVPELCSRRDGHWRPVARALKNNSKQPPLSKPPKVLVAPRCSHNHSRD